MSSRAVRSLRRAPARMIASVLAIALAVGAIGVFAVPDVASGTLREIARIDRLAHVSADVRPVSATDLSHVRERLDSRGIIVDSLEGQIIRTLDIGGLGNVTVVGVDPENQQIDRVSAVEGRLPIGPDELLVSDGMAEIGDHFETESGSLEVVGIGGSAWWAAEEVAFADLATARSLTGLEGFNRVVLRLDDPADDNLDAAVVVLREALPEVGSAFTSFPRTVPDGAHPIESDLEQISFLIGLLGVVAGVVALTLLASTTNTLIAERTREVAVMRALGGRRRALRIRLRRIALAIAVAGVAIGIPLGLVVANVIARMVLQRFVGLTPDLGYSLTVIVASAAFALIGARLVAARASRRVTRTPLAAALRDREGAPFGRRIGDRLLARIPTGGLIGRLAVRHSAHRRARTVAIVAQTAAGVAAILVVTSLGSSVTAFEDAEIEPWVWDSATYAVDPGLPFSAEETATGASTEVGIEVLGELDGWEVDVIGLEPDTRVIDNEVREGEWLGSVPEGVVLTHGFARHQGIAVGDTVEVELASGPVTYPVVGLHRWRSVAVIVPLDVLAADLGFSGGANVIYSLDSTTEIPVEPGVATSTVTPEQLNAEDAAARKAVVAIFGAIGLVVAVVALLGVASATAVSLFERRHELAALRAIGGTEAHVRRTLLLELVPLALVASGLGAVGGWYGAHAIIGVFEESNAIEIGTVFDHSTIPAAAAVVVGAVTIIAILAARASGRRPAAATLREAA